MIAADYGDYRKKSVPETNLLVDKLCGAKSLEKRLRCKPNSPNSETFVKESETIGVLNGNLAKLPYKPFGGFAAKITPTK